MSSVIPCRFEVGAKSPRAAAEPEEKDLTSGPRKSIKEDIIAKCVKIHDMKDLPEDEHVPLFTFVSPRLRWALDPHVLRHRHNIKLVLEDQQKKKA